MYIYSIYQFRCVRSLAFGCQIFFAHKRSKEFCETWRRITTIITHKAICPLPNQMVLFCGTPSLPAGRRGHGAMTSSSQVRIYCVAHIHKCYYNKPSRSCFIYIYIYAPSAFLANMLYGCQAMLHPSSRARSGRRAWTKERQHYDLSAGCPSHMPDMFICK